MTIYESPTLKIDPVAISLRTFGVRLTSLEKLFAATTRQAAEPGPPGPQGAPGPRGPIGPQGGAGPMPMHEWSGTRLRFQQGPDGSSWGEWVDLQGPKGDAQSMGAGPVNVSALAAAVADELNCYMPMGW